MAEPKEFISKGRLDALIDGVFAFAMTLLLPEDFHPKSAKLVAGHAQILVVPDLRQHARQKSYFSLQGGRGGDRAGRARADHSDLKRLIKGQMDGIGARPRLRAAASDGALLIDEAYAPERVGDAAAALAVAGAWLRETRSCMAARATTVRGLVDAAVLADLERYVSLAPLHQPNNLAPMRLLLARFPALVQVACFDTNRRPSSCAAGRASMRHAPSR